MHIPTYNIPHRPHTYDQLCLELHIHCHSNGRSAPGREGPAATGIALQLMARSRITTTCSIPLIRGNSCSSSHQINTPNNTPSPSFPNISPSADGNTTRPLKQSEGSGWATSKSGPLARRGATLLHTCNQQLSAWGHIHTALPINGDQ